MKILMMAGVICFVPATGLACNSWDQDGECADLFQFDGPPVTMEPGRPLIVRRAIAANIACLHEMNAHVGSGPVDSGPACRRWYGLDQKLPRAIGSARQ